MDTDLFVSRVAVRHIVCPIVRIRRKNCLVEAPDAEANLLKQYHSAVRPILPLASESGFYRKRMGQDSLGTALGW